MTTIQTKTFDQLAEAVIAALNAADWTQLRATVAPDVVYTETGTQRRTRGVDEYIQLVQGWKQAFPDLHGTIQKVASSGNTVVQEITWGGTQRASLPGSNGVLPTSGKLIMVPASVWYTFQGDKIQEIYHRFDVVSMGQQFDALLNESSRKRYAVDEQTGEVYELKQESKADHIAAIISISYILLSMALFFWLLFDVWIERFSLANLLGYDMQRLASPSFLLPAYAIIGGALGGIVNGIRSFLVWHAERFAFGQRFLWKYIAAPWLGAALALFTFALIRSGVAIFSGDGAPDTTASASQVLATFGVGVLAGYGANKVFVWLDAQVTRIFQIQSTTVIVPTLTGKTLEEAEEVLKTVRLQLGKVEKGTSDDILQAGKVIHQVPQSGLSVASGASVTITIGSRDTQVELGKQ